MASVPEEEQSEGGRTYTVSTNSEDEEEGITTTTSKAPNSTPYFGHRNSSPVDRTHRKSFDSFFAPRGSLSPNPELVRRFSESYSQAKVVSPIADGLRKSVDQFAARAKNSSGEFHFPAPTESCGDEKSVLSRSAERSSTVYDPGCNSFTPRDPECPIHSPKHGSLRSSPARSVPTTPVRSGPLPPASRSVPTTPVRETATRPTSLERKNSPARASPNRYSPVRASSSSRLSSLSPARTPPMLPSPTRMLDNPLKMDDDSRKSPTVGTTPRSSAAESELLHCTICTQQFNNPKVLPCLHTFCENCLVSTTPRESLTISCPQCKQQSILPIAGVTDLQSNTWVQGVIDSLDTVPPTNGTSNNAVPMQESELDELEPPQPASKGDDSFSPTPLTPEDVVEEHPTLQEEERPVPDEGGQMDDTGFGDETKLYCPSHEGMTLRFYCRDCDTAVCISCTDIEHRMHSTLRLADAMHDQTNALHALVEAVGNKVPALQCCIEDLDDSIETLKEKKNTAEHNIRDTFATLRKALDVREQQLLDTLNRKAEEKQKMLEVQKKELQMWCSNMEGGRELVKRAVGESKAPMELVLLKKQFGDRLKEHVEADLPSGPRENTLLSFEKAHYDLFLSSLKKVGFVVTNPAVPFTTIASGDSLKQVIVGRKGHITVITRDFRGERVGVGGAELTATFTPKYPGTTPSPPVSPCSYSSKGSYPNVAAAGSSNHLPSAAPSEKSSSPPPILNGHSNGAHRAYRRQSTSEDSTHQGASHNTDLYSVKLTDHNTGIYDVEFVLHRAGLHSLDLCLYGMPIDQSPFTVRAVTSGSTCSIHGSEHSVESPFGHTRQRQSARFSTLSTRTPKTSSSRKTPSQRSSGSRITLPIEDDLIMKIGIKGRNKGEFVNPQGICYSSLRGGRIVVTDSISQCVQVFSSEGEFKIRFGTRGRNVGQLQRPTGVGVLPNGNYAVADYENKCVSIFEPNGKFVNRIGHGKLLGPKGVCADRHGNVIVVDNKGSCICIFQPNGKLLTKFGNRGLTYLNFAGPHFVAVNSQDHIVATDFHNHCVKVFDSTGEFLFTFGNHGEGNGQFNAPTGIAVDDHDNIIVADWGNCRIQVFDSRGSFLSFVNTLADPLHGPQGLTFTEDGHVVVADSGNHCYKVYKYLQ